MKGSDKCITKVSDTFNLKTIANTNQYEHLLLKVLQYCYQY